jgi:tellurite methyltransferase
VKVEFWERDFHAGAPGPFGSASAEVLTLLCSLRPGARVLDLGCGAGRHALPLARAGMDVTAVDEDPACCAELGAMAAEVGAAIQIVTQDVARFLFLGSYDAVLAYGVLHLLEPRARRSLLERMRAHTSFGGANVIHARVGDAASEFFAGYADWDVIVRRTELDHELLVARRPLK